MPHSRRDFLLGGALTVGLLISGCSADPAGTASSSKAPATTTPPPPPAEEVVVLAFTPPAGAQNINPLDPVTVTATTGTVTTVRLADADGKPVPGDLDSGTRTWKSAEPLGYGTTYTMSVDSTNPEGMTGEQTSTFTTLTPNNLTKPYFATTGGKSLAGDAPFGVGTVVVAHFDEQIPDKAAAERTLTVTTDPPVAGAWNWVNGQDAHWRPEKYFAPGTKLTAAAQVYGRDLGDRLYGQEDVHTAFTIGDSHVSIADDHTKQVSVFENDKLVRTMPTSMGMGGSERVGNQTITFWTQPGTYTVLSKANPVVMDSSTFGLPVNSRLGYKETINYATKISTDGIYLHQLDATVWAQGNTNLSHGCLNLSGANARWFFDFSQPGDVVQVKNTGGAPLQVWQNGDWSVPWATWLAGSALHSS